MAVLSWESYFGGIPYEPVLDDTNLDSSGNDPTGDYSIHMIAGHHIEIEAEAVSQYSSIQYRDFGIQNDYIKDDGSLWRDYFDDNSLLKLYSGNTDGDDEQGFLVGKLSVTFERTYDEDPNCTDAKFIIGSIDGNGEQALDMVVVKAYDFDGNEVPVELTLYENSSLTITPEGEVIGGSDATGFTDATSSLQVEINEPFYRIEIEYTQLEESTYVQDGAEMAYPGYVTISDIHFHEKCLVPCFTSGTLIATPRGEVNVEDLRVGDRVITRDNGIQVIRWVGARTLKGRDLVRNDELRPVLIRAGALGNGLPERDMKVSPNHRMLIASERSAFYFEEREVLVAAKHLVGQPGIQYVDIDEVTYVHFMFDQHEVVLSDGTWTESFQPGDYTLRGIDGEQRKELVALFPELGEPKGADSYMAARRSLKRYEAQLLLQ